MEVLFRSFVRNYTKFVENEVQKLINLGDTKGKAFELRAQFFAILVIKNNLGRDSEQSSAPHTLRSANEATAQAAKG
jgi:hypothetical protein